MTDREDDYSVGYGRPPLHTRFQKGCSGNPRGKPKGARSFKADLEAELSEMVRISENGRPRKLTKQLLLLKTTFSRAIKGDARATGLLFDLIGRHLPSEPSRPEEPALTVEEEAMLEAHLAKLLDRRTQGGAR